MKEEKKCLLCRCTIEKKSDDKVEQKAYEYGICKRCYIEEIMRGERG